MDAIAIKNGGWKMMFGYAGDDEPSTCFPPTLGIINNHQKDNKLSKDEYTNIYIGELASKYSNFYEKNHFFEHGIPQDVSILKELYQFAFLEELKISPEEKSFVCTENIATPPKIRQSILDMMFEDFSVKNYFVASDSVMSLYSCGRFCGIVADLGETHTSCVPIYEGFAIPHACFVSHLLCGKKVDEYIRSFIPKETLLDDDVILDLKHRWCDNLVNLNDPVTDKDKEKYLLPDNIEISFKERAQSTTSTLQIQKLFRSANSIYYDPSKYLSLKSNRLETLPRMILDSILACDSHLQKELLETINLSGGSSLGIITDDLSARIDLDIVSRSNTSDTNHLGKSKVRAPSESERKIYPWIGASILGSLNSFGDYYVKRELFQESGPTCLNMMCPSTWCKNMILDNSKNFLDDMNDFYKSDRNKKSDTFLHFH